MRKLVVAAALVVALSGCYDLNGNSWKAQSEMEASKAAYKSCLASNAADPRACEPARLAYEADLRAVRATSIVPR